MAILKDTIFSTKTKTPAVSLIGYAKDYSIPISNKKDTTIIKIKINIQLPIPLYRNVDVKMDMVTIGWAEETIREGGGETPASMPTIMDTATAEAIIKIKDPPKGPTSRDLCFLLSPMAMAVNIMALVKAGEVITDEEDPTIIMVLLRSLLGHQGIEVLHPQDHLDIIVLLLLQDGPDIMVLLHQQDLMDAVDIIGIMGRPLLLDMGQDIMDRLHPDSQVIGIMDHLLPLVDASISRAHLHHLDVDASVDLLHLDMDQDIMDIETTKDEDLGPKVLMEEIIKALLPLDIKAVLVHLLHASVRSIIPTVVGIDNSLLVLKGMAM